ncbi:MAG: hypothetical protein K8S62_01745 [Candidatus Sabulitectum sp.]|nr:hypothetical protein [Candidatus Sabulitectum sp.]
MNIIWHVSSHGWGHAARQRELIRVYRLKFPNTHITVASDVPHWFWDGSEIDSFVPGSPSPIAIEKDGDIDLQATRLHYQSFLHKIPDYLKAEVARQHDHKPDLIITDIDPLPVKAAEIGGIPALGISNFTWDWIMKEMFSDLLKEAELIADMYRHATFLKLPLGPNHSPFHSTIDVPLLRGGPSGNSEKAKKLLPCGRICLVALRETPPGIKLSIPEGFTAVSSLPQPAHKLCHNITHYELSQAGATFADLVAACDVVISKPGYGIVSQILAMGKRAVLFTGRQFPEEKSLISPLLGHSGTALIGIDGTASTQSEISKVMEKPCPAPVQCNGSEAIVKILHSL